MSELGPQNPKDPPFTARIRLHQSWYRARVLKAPFGTGPKQGSKTYLGNMLVRGDGERGLNFLTPHIFSIAKRRLAEKKGLIDHFRLLCDMMSTQALCFNLFGPLVDDHELAAGVFRLLFSNEIGRVRRVRLVNVPEPAGELNDPKGFDAFIEYERPDGKPAFIGIETYQTDGLKARPSVQPAYWKWTKRAGSPWPEPAWPSLVDSEINLLWRGHLLQQAMTHLPGSPYAAGYFLVLYHPLDETSMHRIQAYQSLLKPGDTSFSALPLDVLIGRWRTAVIRKTDEEWSGEFVKRYLDFRASENEVSASK